jgi:hypothetical protein
MDGWKIGLAPQLTTICGTVSTTADGTPPAIVERGMAFSTERPLASRVFRPILRYQVACRFVMGFASETTNRNSLEAKYVNQPFTSPSSHCA